MAISDRINEMYTHVGDVYDTITNVDLPTNKNIQNIPSTMRSSYLEIMNNGIDKIWNNWEKVTGEGETLTLNSTEEAPMKIDLKGNTSQETTTGKNKLDLTGITSITVAAGITITPNFNGTLLQNIKISGTPTTTTWQSIKNFSLGAGTYILNGINISQTNKTGLRIGIYIDKSRQWFITSNSPTYTFTLNETTTCQFVIWVQSTTDFPTTDTYITPMIRLSSVTDDTYEPYTNGASPNPDYPQDIHVVSGDNSINVCGKNLLSMEDSTRTYTGGISVTTTNNTRIIFNGTASATYYTSNPLEYELQPGTYTISGTNSNRKYYFWFRDDESNTISNVHINGTNSATFTHPSKTTKLAVGIEGLTTGTSYNEITDIQLEKGTTATTYEAYKGASYPINLGNIELCKIGDYQDKIAKSTGKNLFDGETELGSYDNNGNKSVNNNCRRTIDFIEVKSSTTYILSRSGSTFNCKYLYYDENKNYISSQVLNSSFTTPDNCYYLNFFSDQLPSNYANLMLNEGTTALPYEPYGTGWYLNKQIGKITFNGSENWGRSGNTSESFFCGALAGVNIPFQAKMGTAVDSKCNYFAKGNSHSNAEVFDMYNGTDYYTAFALYLSTSRVTDVTTFKNWLASNNTTLYYVLYQPTYTEITDTTLLEQLEAFYNAKSKNSQTNISQENNDKPFILDATALKQLTQ